MSGDFFSFEDFYRALGAYSWWSVAIEWLIIGTVLYWIMRFLRGTRGARLLRGIALFLIGLYALVSFLDGLGLERVAFLYRQFLSIAALAVIVVFQPELRRALMRLGETRLFRGWSGQVGEDIAELVEAATFCSKRKIGALIAVERDVGLGGIAETATRINADLTAELLETIFWPNSPLHDLGVVISQGKVAFAGVQFPLAEEGTLERELGSRHRAAVGLSNESDAVVIVVSEETGDISIAERGVLMRKLTPDALRGMLAELLNATEKKAADEIREAA
jgi:diadenylate cyclase